MVKTFEPGVEAERMTRYGEIDTGYRAPRWHETTLYEQSRPGTVNQILPSIEPELAAETTGIVDTLPAAARRAVPPALPEVSEPEILRHYIRCSQMTFGYDSGSNVGVGTCTMKYSPRLNEEIARLPKLRDLHPLEPEAALQGVLELMYGLRNWLRELAGMDEVTFQPRGGGHGAYTDALMIRAHHRARNQNHRDEMITCAVSHPCNPAAAAAAGFRVISLYPDPVTGEIGIEALRAAISPRTAGIMVTAPYDTGVFDSKIAEYARLVHDAGGVVSLDQANFNGVMTRMRAGDLGADMVHFNLHKTFSTPHGSYGPGACAVAVKEGFVPFLPVPLLRFDGESYHLDHDLPLSIGKVGTFLGMVPNVVKAYAYVLAMGQDGLRAASEWAVINNNYLIRKLLEVRGLAISYPNRRKLQEARFTLRKLFEDTGVTTTDFNYRLADFGVATYFESHVPRIIDEPVTPEPTEGQSKRDLDRFIAAFHQISAEAYREPEIVKTAPHRCIVRREVHDYRSLTEVPFTWRVWRRMHGDGQPG
ncbi:MAG TPA: aminomethyl-transferring glycine dehydrogenase subunit GcvPB [Candidatus Binatia bacterium]|nr:aminomethyl-transferring glycine dehydrogenase subunit GcvPB [Candidatus Binatia bacterium]